MFKQFHFGRRPQAGALPPEALESVLTQVKELDMAQVHAEVAKARAEQENGEAEGVGHGGTQGSIAPSPTGFPQSAQRRSSQSSVRGQGPCLAPRPRPSCFAKGVAVLPAKNPARLCRALEVPDLCSCLYKAWDSLRPSSRRAAATQPGPWPGLVEVTDLRSGKPTST